MGLRAFLLHFFFAVFIGGISTIFTAILVSRLRILDIPNERSSHSIPIPRGGGLAIAAGFFIGVSLIQIFGKTVPLRSDYFWGFLFSLLLIAGVSIYDDIQHRGIRVKLGTQLVSIIVAMAAGNVIDIIYLPWIGEVRAFMLVLPLSLVWLLGLTNAYNFMDGLDGMAGATAVVVSGFFSYIAFQEGSHFVYLMSLILCVATLGFLFFNWPPARIFMGDVGSTFLGFTFATLAIVAARYDLGHTSLFVMPLLLFHFIFDSIFTFARRLMSGENVFQAHRTHLYQLINRLGYSHKVVTSAYAGAAVIQGFAAVWMVGLPGEQRLLVFLPFAMCYFLVGIRILACTRRELLL
jgi:UDP-GlcNAc:undecaprenyl-phosphate GlcNAc-1-phosphate transferase